MLARSLMRDIAAAVETAQPRTANAVSVALSVPFISCSPRGRTPITMPVACHARRGNKLLKSNDFIFEGSACQRGAASSPCRFRQVLPGFYRPLTIRAHLLIMRVYGPNGTAVAPAPPPARRSAGGTFALSDSE